MGRSAEKRPLEKMTIRGFKSIKALEDFELGSLNVLIGANGAGKSNFVEIFRMLRALADEGFGNYVLNRGEADSFLFNGPKNTNDIEVIFKFGDNSYSCILEPTVSGKFLIKEEKKSYKGTLRVFGKDTFESRLKSNRNEESSWYSDTPGIGYYVYEAISSWMVYHVHDTSSQAGMRRSEITADNSKLRENASNIAPYLLKLRKTDSSAYHEIIDSIRLVTPFFDDFLLQVDQKGEKELVNLSWKQKGSDYPMQPYHFSDGTIRFICLATALLQPDPPSTIVIDEPELGLHPYAIEILSELIQVASERTQVVVSTQSPLLIDHFEPKDIVVVNRKDGASTFHRLDQEKLSQWLQDYTLGELWRKNIVAGGPVHE